jgi:hypothetical protein
MMEDPVFANTLHNRYYELRERFLHTDSLYAYIDSATNLIDEAQQRHYTKWGTLGRNVGTPEVGEIPTTFEGEVQRLKDIIDVRFNWLDEQMENFYTEGYGVYDLNTNPVLEPPDIGISVTSVVRNTTARVFPNPASEILYVEHENPIAELAMINVMGQIVYTNKNNIGYTARINVSEFQQGIYFIKGKTIEGKEFVEKVIRK